MNWDFSEMVELFSQKSAGDLLLQGRWGIEKESLRVTGAGDLALTPHPRAFGDKMDNPFIQTDFSESQLELITPPFNTIEETHEFLYGLHLQVEKAIGDELIWPLSMPGRLPEESIIPASHYNGSPQGEIKEIYRSGLALRYGKKMQMISGIHFNFSFRPELLDYLYKKFSVTTDRNTFVNDTYFALVRNYMRYRWLLIYLFGASPAAEDSFIDEFGSDSDPANLNEADPVEIVKSARETISLRMSRFGYNSPLQENIAISYNSLDEYIRDLRTALWTTSPVFSKLGVDKDGRRIQLNDNILQIENEYYAPARFKQIATEGESQIDALEERGINHVELRIFDLNPFEKTGISLEQMRFIQIFTLFCLFEKSDPLTSKEMDIINSNAEMTALSGRKEGLQLMDAHGAMLPLTEYGEYIFSKLRVIAELVDLNTGDKKYSKNIEYHLQQLRNPSLLPSQKVMDEMERNNESYEAFGLRMAMEHIKCEIQGNKQTFSKLVSPYMINCCRSVPATAEYSK